MENLNELGLPEIKSLCKKYEISPVGDKKDLIKKLKYFLDPVEGTLNQHSGRKIPPNKKIKEVFFITHLGINIIWWINN
jgi:hypothetical protein